MTRVQFPDAEFCCGRLFRGLVVCYLVCSDFDALVFWCITPYFGLFEYARLAQSVERQALNLMVVGSSPTVGDCI